MTTLTFLLYRRGELRTIIATLHPEWVDTDGCAATVIEDVTAPEQPFYPVGADNLACHDAVEEICLRARTTRIGGVPTDPEKALKIQTHWWNGAQALRHSSDHPDGRSDAQTYREEAPYGSER